ncbi:MAG: helix-turn-helix domain-containing protein [Clostridia bacterium]
MENLNEIVARNLRSIREEKKLSLDKVAELTGVSKSMLGQIERGESNPTITTVWKIAKGLKISFTTLINTPQHDTVIIHRSEIEPLIEDNGKYRLYPYFPYEDGRRFEVYSVEIEKGGYLSAEAHAEGTQEFITVFDSELTIRVNDQEFAVKEGDSIRFKADKPHVYHNSGNKLAKVSLVIYYPI